MGEPHLPAPGLHQHVGRAILILIFKDFFVSLAMLMQCSRNAQILDCANLVWPGLWQDACSVGGR